MGTSEHAEVERKYESAGDDGVGLEPALGAVRGLNLVGEPVVLSLDATYFDTTDLGLLAHRITLRRRTGGDDAGWHLKLPVSGDERRELSQPLGRATRTPPKTLLDEVRAFLRGCPVAPVATLLTERTEYQLRSPDGSRGVSIAADRVRAEGLPGGAPAHAWTEVEAEVVDGPARTLDRVEGALLDAGLVRSSWPSKLARALGDRVPEPRPVPWPKKGSRAGAGEVLLAHLDEQLNELLARDAAVRADAPDAVHKMRVASRRLRSALATGRPLLDGDSGEPIRAELKWLGAQLGRPRDAEVQQEGLLALLDRQPKAHVVGPVRRRIRSELRARHDVAHRDLLAALDGDRYRRLLGRLDALIVDPPLSSRAGRPARDELRTLTAKASDRFDKAVRRSRSASTPDELAVALHDVRKAAKRARYAAEVATAIAGKPADRLAQRMQAVQEVLGVHQDAVTARLLLRELAAIAQAAGENAFTYGVLHGAEHERARLARVGYADVLRDAQKPRVRKWLGT